MASWCFGRSLSSVYSVWCEWMNNSGSCSFVLQSKKFGREIARKNNYRRMICKKMNWLQLLSLLKIKLKVNFWWASPQLTLHGSSFSGIPLAILFDIIYLPNEFFTQFSFYQEGFFLLKKYNGPHAQDRFLLHFIEEHFILFG